MNHCTHKKYGSLKKYITIESVLIYHTQTILIMRFLVWSFFSILKFLSFHNPFCNNLFLYFSYDEIPQPIMCIDLEEFRALVQSVYNQHTVTEIRDNFFMIRVFDPLSLIPKKKHFDTKNSMAVYGWF